ncbi:hypothetical protein F511_36012 [Dorcoceras hygrometricum]|uniref:Uncharacterized protein n=1 Tax=Dorcoceras hygrometricum TaxID=472368 RepID=A0A2Z7C3F9_9LAMI|nr:hypothetical protein F511_36012 [Dorcoceras hygrometricum]
MTKFDERFRSSHSWEKVHKYGGDLKVMRALPREWDFAGAPGSSEDSGALGSGLYRGASSSRSGCSGENMPEIILEYKDFPFEFENDVKLFEKEQTTPMYKNTVADIVKGIKMNNKFDGGFLLAGLRYTVLLHILRLNTVHHLLHRTTLLYNILHFVTQLFATLLCTSTTNLNLLLLQAGEPAWVSSAIWLSFAGLHFNHSSNPALAPSWCTSLGVLCDLVILCWTSSGVSSLYQLRCPLLDHLGRPLTVLAWISSTVPARASPHCSNFGHPLLDQLGRPLTVPTWTTPQSVLLSACNQSAISALFLMMQLISVQCFVPARCLSLPARY